MRRAGRASLLLLLLIVAGLAAIRFRAAQMFLPLYLPAPPTIFVKPVQLDPEPSFAVVPGGIHSIEELRRVIASDPQVAALYGGFDLASARIVPLKQDVWAYLAYRKDGHIFYTGTLHRIRAGELVIEDGQGMMILVRCGNLIATAPLPDNLIAEVEPPNIYPPDFPPPPSFSAPPTSPLPPSPPADPTPPVPPTEPPYPPPTCCLVPVPPPNNPPVHVPEPSSGVLSFVGLAALVGLRLFKRGLAA